MKTAIKLLAVSSLALAALTGVHAETYDGVHEHISTKDPRAVSDEAVRTASAPNQNVTRGSRGMEAFTPMANPDKVYAEAVGKAHEPDQNVPTGSKYNSRIISTMKKDTSQVQAQKAEPAAK